MSRIIRIDAAATARNLVGPLVRLAYDIEVWGVHHIPPRGALLIVGDQPELMAGPVIKACAPRPVHVIATDAVMQAVPGRAIVAAGDIPNPEPGIDAATQALRLLDRGAAVVLLGAAPAAGYLAAASGADVATVSVRGAGGRVATDPPRPGSRIEVRFGPAITMAVSGDPVAMSTVRATGERVRQRLADAQAEARLRSGEAAPAARSTGRMMSR